MCLLPISLLFDNCMLRERMCSCISLNKGHVMGSWPNTAFHATFKYYECVCSAHSFTLHAILAVQWITLALRISCYMSVSRRLEYQLISLWRSTSSFTSLNFMYLLGSIAISSAFHLYAISSHNAEFFNTCEIHCTYSRFHLHLNIVCCMCPLRRENCWRILLRTQTDAVVRWRWH